MTNLYPKKSKSATEFDVAKSYAERYFVLDVFNRVLHCFAESTLLSKKTSLIASLMIDKHWSNPTRLLKIKIPSSIYLR